MKWIVIADRKEGFATNLRMVSQVFMVAAASRGLGCGVVEALAAEGAAAAFLLSDRASCITGETLVVDGGKTSSL